MQEILPDRPTFQIAHKYSLDHVDNGPWDQHFPQLSTETRHHESASKSVSQHSVMQLKKGAYSAPCACLHVIKVN